MALKKESFLGAELYQPTIEAIYQGLGIPTSTVIVWCEENNRWETITGNQYLRLINEGKKPMIKPRDVVVDMPLVACTC